MWTSTHRSRAHKFRAHQFHNRRDSERWNGKKKSSFARRHFLFRRKWNYLDHSPESILNQRLLKAFACAFHGFIWRGRWLNGGRVTWFCHMEEVLVRQVKFTEKFPIIELRKFHNKLQTWTSSSLRHLLTPPLTLPPFTHISFSTSLTT
jgi:hypothetical protein